MFVMLPILCLALVPTVAVAMMLMMCPILSFGFCAACGNDADDASIVCCHATAHGNDASDWLLSFVSLAAKTLIILAIVCFLRCCPRQ